LPIKNLSGNRQINRAPQMNAGGGKFGDSAGKSLPVAKPLFYTTDP